MTALVTADMAEAERATPRQCPRCAYDLSGVIASWQSACPLAGTCSECGLGFRWQDIFNEKLSGPPWSFEHAARLSSWRLLVTAWMVTWPWSAWRELRLEIPIVARRLILLPLLAYALFHLLVAAVAWIDIFQDTALIAFRGLEYAFFFEAIPALLWPYSRQLSWMDASTPPTWLAWVALQWAFMPMLMLILDETMRRVRVRRVHILRGACYSVVAPIVGTVISGTVALVDSLRLVWIDQEILASFILAPTACLAWWWYGFIKDYLRLPRALLITGVLMGVTLFGSFTLMFAGMVYLG